MVIKYNGTDGGISDEAESVRGRYRSNTYPLFSVNTPPRPTPRTVTHPLLLSDYGGGDCRRARLVRVRSQVHLRFPDFWGGEGWIHGVLRAVKFPYRDSVQTSEDPEDEANLELCLRDKDPWGSFLYVRPFFVSTFFYFLQSFTVFLFVISQKVFLSLFEIFNLETPNGVCFGSLIPRLGEAERGGVEDGEDLYGSLGEVRNMAKQ